MKKMHSVWVASILYAFFITVRATDNATETVSLNSTESQFTLPAFLEGKHESLQSCLAYELKPHQVEFLPDGFIHIPRFDLTLNESFYASRDGMIFFCPSNETEKAETEQPMLLQAYLTVIGLIVSMIGLFLHLVVFILVPELRNQPGWNLAALCVSLFISYLLLLLNGEEIISNNEKACAAFASLKHFFLLASFLWMSIMSCDVFVTLRRVTVSLRRSSTEFSRRKFGVYCLIAFGIALLFAIFGVLADALDFVPQHYRPKFHVSCWFKETIPFVVLFIAPVVLFSCLNFLFFGLSVYIIHFNKRKNDQDAQKSTLNIRYMMYFRLSVLMGVTWVVLIIANIANVEWLWCIFALMNALQGFFIFLGFTCTKKVKKYVHQKLQGVKSSSLQTSVPTFQSYCSYDDSEDLDKTERISSSRQTSVSTIQSHSCYDNPIQKDIDKTEGISSPRQTSVSTIESHSCYDNPIQIDLDNTEKISGEK